MEQINVLFYFYSIDNHVGPVSFPPDLPINKARGLIEMHSFVDQIIDLMHDLGIQNQSDDYQFPSGCKLVYKDVQFTFDYCHIPDVAEIPNSADLGWLISRIVINKYTFKDVPTAFSFIEYYIKSDFTIDSNFNIDRFCNSPEKYFNRIKNIA